jgi:hypothetical protein
MQINTFCERVGLFIPIFPYENWSYGKVIGRFKNNIKEIEKNYREIAKF